MARFKSPSGKKAPAASVAPPPASSSSAEVSLPGSHQAGAREPQKAGSQITQDLDPQKVQKTPNPKGAGQQETSKTPRVDPQNAKTTPNVDQQTTVKKQDAVAQATPELQGTRKTPSPQNPETPQNAQNPPKTAVAERALKPPKAPKAPKAAKAPKAPVARKPASAPPPPAPREAEPAETPLRILMVASEAQPFSKTGGLADVSSALSRALGRLGHDVTLFTPRYRGVQPGQHRGNVRALVGGQWYEAELQEVALGPGARAMLVDCAALYDRAGIYSEHRWDYPDNATRFAFLAIAALEWAASQPQKPDVLHGHDWQAGLLPVYARETPSVFTIHNIAYQGNVEKEWVPRLGLRWDDFHVNGFEFWDRLSLLKAGVKFAHALTTVSPTYADEIQRPEYGYGFDGVMRSRADALVGILNGIDVDEWNPAHDAFLPAPFDVTRLEGKRQSKRALLDLFGLPSDDAAMARPVIGMVSRMVHQKGLDLIAALAPQLATLDATFTIVGTGEPRYEEMWRVLAAAAPQRFSVHVGFDERRAHLVEAGADAFLMPSRYEPCGLNQMYSMRYGTVPIVRAVGGLVDTVRPYDPVTGQGTGFLFGDYDPWALFAAIRRALETYRHGAAWHQLQVNGMTRDFSWERSAAEYVTVYKRVIAARQTS